MLCGAELKIMSGCHKGIEWNAKQGQSGGTLLFAFLLTQAGGEKKEHVKRTFLATINDYVIL